MRSLSETNRDPPNACARKYHRDSQQLTFTENTMTAPYVSLACSPTPGTQRLRSGWS